MDDSLKHSDSLKNIDFSRLLDLRVDFVFKLYFASKDNSRLISLLNAIFANKGIPRVIASLTIENPVIEKITEEDKLSIVDIQAELIDGTIVCIEMHLYGVDALKYKVARNWARIYGGELTAGQAFTDQRPVICVSFINGPITASSEKLVDKTHSLFYIMERDDHQILLPDMELHFINMAAFIKEFREYTKTKTDPREWEFDKFTKWLGLITQREINSEAFIRAICGEEEFIMSVETLSRMDMDKVQWRMYQRRLDELHSQKAVELERDKANQRAEEANQRAEEANQRAEEANQRAEEANQRAEEANRREQEASQQAEEERRNTAKTLKKKNFTIQEIAEIMSLPEGKVIELL